MSATKSGKAKQASAAGTTMPMGGMLAETGGGMPSGDMNASGAAVTSLATGMPAGAMREVAAGDMPAGDMQSATVSAHVSQDMPMGGMLGADEGGMPSGSMLATAGGGQQAWNMDVSSTQPCGCN